jgi:uncharacterized membrane protein YbhN (UPF0104 family)
MRQWIRRFLPVIKWVLTIAILIAVGRAFYRDLSKHPNIWREAHLGWSAVSGALYILALCCYSTYWMLMLRGLDQTPSFTGSLRAYFLGLLGKYLPGKAWALVLRAGIAANDGVRVSVAGMTSFYEVLTTMTAGALLAAILFALVGPTGAGAVDWDTFVDLLRMRHPESVVVGRNALVLLSLGLMVACGFPIVPPIFNRLAHRLSLPFRDRDAEPLPKIRTSMLLQGLLLGLCGWVLMGLSLAAAVEAVMHVDMPWDAPFLGRMMACMALGYVAGFVIIFMPSGLGVREFFLALLLIPELRDRFGVSSDLAAAQAETAAILLRLSWTAAEVVVAAIVYWFPARQKVEQQEHSTQARG